MSHESHESLSIPNGPELPDPSSLAGQKLAFLILQERLVSDLDLNGVIEKGKDTMINSQHDDDFVVHFFDGGSGVSLQKLTEDSALNSVMVGEMPSADEEGIPKAWISALRFSRVVQMPSGELVEAYAWVPILNPNDVNQFNSDFRLKDYELVEKAILQVDEAVDQNQLTEVTDDLAGMDRLPDKPYILRS